MRDIDRNRQTFAAKIIVSAPDHVGRTRETIIGKEYVESNGKMMKLANKDPCITVHFSSATGSVAMEDSNWNYKRETK